MAVLGLSFKPHTDDIRNSRAIPIVKRIQDLGGTAQAYDPAVSDEMRELFPELKYVESAVGTLEDADGALVVMDWPEFAELDAEFDVMSPPVVVDGRRIVERRDGRVYEGLT